MIGEFDQGLFHTRIVAVTGEVDEEVILPRFFLARARFNLGEVDFVLFERFQRIMQRADAILRGKHDRGLVAAGACRIFAANHKKSRDVFAGILNVFVVNGQAVFLRG